MCIHKSSVQGTTPTDVWKEPTLRSKQEEKKKDEMKEER